MVFMEENKASKTERIKRLRKHYIKEMISCLILPIVGTIGMLFCIIIILSHGGTPLYKENIPVIVYCGVLILLFCILWLRWYKSNKNETRERINDEIFSIIYYEDIMRELNCVENDILNEAEDESDIIQEPTITIEIPEKYVSMIGHRYYWLDLDTKKVRKVMAVNIEVDYNKCFKTFNAQVVIMYKRCFRHHTKKLSEKDCEFNLFQDENAAKETLKYFV